MWRLVGCTLTIALGCAAIHAAPGQEESGLASRSPESMTASEEAGDRQEQAPPGTSRVEQLLREYVEAGNEGDIAALIRMTAEAALWVRGSQALPGRDRMLAPFRFDQGVPTRLEIVSAVPTEDGVDVETVETSILLSAIGMQGIRRIERFVFVEGRLTRRERLRPTPDGEEFARRIEPFRGWVGKNHPGDLSRLPGPDGYIPIPGDAEPRLADHVREWLRAGAPGRQPGPQEAAD